MKPSRRWLRFSLRALLVMVTLACMWLAWEVNVVRTRRVMRKEAEAKGLVFFNREWYSDSDLPARETPFARISFIRRWLGDEAVQVIMYDPWHNQSESDAKPYLHYFPEAEFYEVSPRNLWAQ